ncbi:hypothetical protein AC249_AIPGENE18064 [Exaiptasia diaphana]|nr:hypothetical protein AC249_AIPGENE18064 [Exaiptasia diaphana]
MAYRIGTHTYPINEKCTKVDSKTIEEMQKMGWDEVEKAAMNVMNRKQMENIKQKVKKSMECYVHTFEAVVTFKQHADKKDLLYIYNKMTRETTPISPHLCSK